jgi:glycosyltransferase involved in cell wall biosynthesis
MVGRTIESILNVDLDPNQKVELIVVDNGSTDSTAEVIGTFHQPRFPVRYIYEHVPGHSRALNRAIRESDADVLLFTDDDVEVPSNWLLGISELYLDPCVHAVQGRIRLHCSVVKPWMEGLHRTYLAEFDNQTAYSCVGANMSARRLSIIACGGFDEDLGPGTVNGFGADDRVGHLMTAKFGEIKVYSGDPVIHSPRVDRLTRKSLFARMELQVKSEIRLRALELSEFPQQAKRPVWMNWILLQSKILRDRLLHPTSPATQDELGGYRSLLLSRHIASIRR